MEASRAGPAPGRGAAGGGAAAAMEPGDTILSDLEAMLRRMEDTGAVDPRLPGRIAGLRRMADEARARWEAAGGDWFFVCQAAFSFGLVLDQMEKGIRAERDGGGRPDIASDSISMLPVMSRALRLFRSDAADPDAAGDALGVVNEMMDRSESAGLDPSMEELDGMIDSDELRRIMPAIIKSLDP